MKRTRFLLMILFLQLCVSMQAQIPQEVKKVLATCNEKMSNPAGIEIDMKVSSGIAFTTVQRNFSIMSADHYRSHSEDVLV